MSERETTQAKIVPHRRWHDTVSPLLGEQPKSVGNFPLAVWRITRAAGEYRPDRYFSFCFTRLGLVQLSTCEMPSERFTCRLTRVTRALFSTMACDSEAFSQSVPLVCRVHRLYSLPETLMPTMPPPTSMSKTWTHDSVRSPAGAGALFAERDSDRRRPHERQPDDLAPGGDAPDDARAPEAHGR